MTQVLDARGLECPEPLGMTETVLTQIASGETLRVLTTDPVAPIDFEAYCQGSPHSYLGVTSKRQWQEILIRKG